LKLKFAMRKEEKKKRWFEKLQVYHTILLTTNL